MNVYLFSHSISGMSTLQQRPTHVSEPAFDCARKRNAVPMRVIVEYLTLPYLKFGVR